MWVTKENLGRVLNYNPPPPSLFFGAEWAWPTIYFGLLNFSPRVFFFLNSYYRFEIVLILSFLRLFVCFRKLFKLTELNLRSAI